MRLVWVAILALVASLAQATRIILIPLDNRPAAGQFAQMIGDIDGAQVQMPPYQFLGRFTSPGDPDSILAWLNSQDMSDVSSIIVSADMIAYGGLIASRAPDVPEAIALSRLQTFQKIAKKVRPNVRVYVYSSVMRLAPTATLGTTKWRDALVRYVVARQRAGNPVKEGPALKKLHEAVASQHITRYDAARKRDHDVQIALVQMAMSSFDYLIIGQDDAQIVGPHVPEAKELIALSQKLGVDGKVYFCEGVDQNSNVLLSRALLKGADWIPRIRVVYSDPYGRTKIGAFESKSVQETVHDQVYASGARIVGLNESYDYTLYVNTPGRRQLFFNDFMDDLRNEMDQNLPISIADINLAADGTSDRQLFDALTAENRIMRLAAFAGWNTAGNTLGTAIPATNIMLLAERKNFDPLKLQVAHMKFLLHRVVDDVMYHRQTRPRAYSLIDQLPDGHREETYGDSYTVLTSYVRKDLTDVLYKTFESEVKGRKFSASGATYEFSGLENVRIFLPWPRAYEVRLEFGLGITPVEAAAQQPTTTPPAPTTAGSQKPPNGKR